MQLINYYRRGMINYFEEKCGVPPRIFCIPLGVRVPHFGDHRDIIDR